MPEASADIQASIAVLVNEVKHVRQELDELKGLLVKQGSEYKSTFVTKDEFSAYKQAFWLMAGAIVASLGAAITALWKV
jgi:hypothetical protein